MRATLFGEGFAVGHFIAALGLNVLYMAIGMAIFLAGFTNARRHGALLQQGE